MRRLSAVAPLLIALLGGCDTSGFRDAYLALDADGNRERDRFFTDTEAIYCVGKLASGVDDLTVTGALRATQIYDPGTGEPTDVDFYLGSEEQAPGASEDITVSFLLEREDPDQPYVAGRYVCELALDGVVEERLPFEVAFPACPEAPLVTGLLCRGFVLSGASCPGAFDQTCECGADGAWSCR